MEASCLSLGWLVPEWHRLSHIAEALVQLWDQLELDLLVSSHTDQGEHYYTLENVLTLGALELNAFNHPWTHQVSSVFPPPALVPLVLPKFLVQHVTGQFRILILVAPCRMEVPWLPTVLNILKDICHQCPIINDLTMDVSVDWVFKGLPDIIKPYGCSEVCVALTTVLFLCLSESGGGESGIYGKVVPAMLERTGQLVCLRGCTKQCHSAPKVAGFWFTYLGLDWLGAQLLYIHLLFQPF